MTTSFGELFGKVRTKAKEEGIRATLSAIWRTLAGRGEAENDPVSEMGSRGCFFVDVLFINGCDYSVPHPVRYRIDHQMQQLKANGLAVERIDAWNISLDQVGMARNFIIFRCPYTPLIGEFIAKAKALNKKVYFDIDDLVVDCKYTDAIQYLSSMSPEDRALYDEGVRRMGETLKRCGSAITTTQRLANELRSYVPEVFINRNVSSDEMLFYSNKAVAEREEAPEDGASDVVIGYFSGSITHSEDFDMILPALGKVMEKHPEVSLRIVGELDVPKELERFRERVLYGEFCPWEELPKLIASVDINIVPLKSTIFNEAKSENKWVEASLVKVPTVASDVGAFSQMIESGKTGILCSSLEDWENSLNMLIEDSGNRKVLAESAFAFCSKRCVSVFTGHALACYLRQRQSPNLFMVLPSFNTSGGVLVALRHCCFLQDAGYDVSVVDHSGAYQAAFFEFEDHSFPVVNVVADGGKKNEPQTKGLIDQGVATMWPTLSVLDDWVVKRKQYLVQGYETLLYESPSPWRLAANATYGRQDVEYLTISKWCERWLYDEYGQMAKYAPNGIDTKAFGFQPRNLKEGKKIRILIEGDCGSYYKNIDEAFEIASCLDSSRYEIWYVSYASMPKKGYRIDRFFHCVPNENMPDIYRECDILLKTSFLESFSYPPLEMMATGGYVVAASNGGNAEYLRDGVNCLLYERGDIQGAVAKIELISTDSDIRAALCENGVKMAKEREWSNLSSRIVELYQ